MYYRYSFCMSVPKGCIHTEATHMMTLLMQRTSQGTADSQIITGLPSAVGRFSGGFTALPVLPDHAYTSKTRRPIS